MRAGINLGPLEVDINGRLTAVEFSETAKDEKINLATWLQGKPPAHQYIQELMEERAEPIAAELINNDGKWQLVNEDNAGHEKLFPTLSHEHYGKLACRYNYTIPYLEGVLNGDYGWTDPVLETVFYATIYIDNFNNLPDVEEPIVNVPDNADDVVPEVVPDPDPAPVIVPAQAIPPAPVIVPAPAPQRKIFKYGRKR